MEPHFARVQALTTNGHSNWVHSKRLIPFWGTAIGPPKIKLTSRSRSMRVELFAPQTPFRWKNGSWITLNKVYIDLEYQIDITGNPVDHRPESCRATSTTISIQDLKPRTTYCMHAQIQTPLFHKISEYSREGCATTFDDVE
ncbi:interleukin-22 receptor subunit alpha-2-like [Chiloscyllium plagiosum]|uniref:interleukin-22 receptor subunit alpha-2-like n=1 Tax=Chiloscyllium plagiosum TaxID=36176 RepID=UPI001CB7CC15|nr:interleukin-22 receptor subunit alpha-2-like [Chiloscyllium plagiosum]